MSHTKITEEEVRQKVINILREEDFKYQKIQVNKVGENFNIYIWEKDNHGKLNFAIPDGYFEDKDRETEFLIKLKKTIRYKKRKNSA